MPEDTPLNVPETEPEIPKQNLSSVSEQTSSNAQPELPKSPVVKPQSSRFLKMAVVLLVLIIAAAAIAYGVRSHNRTVTNAKKDIPYLTYGFSGSGDLNQTYPTEMDDDNNTAFIDVQLFEGLVHYQDQTKIVPWLATSWSNPNDTTWVFNLRQGVKFHSGRIMTASDVVASLNYDVANQSSNNGSTNLALASTIDNVKALNPYQVQITTNGPDAVLLNRLANLYIVDSKAKLGSPNAGTGPYIVPGDSIKSNTTSLNLVASSNYWGGHIYTREVHIQEDVTPDQLASDIIAGKLDIAGDFNSQQIANIKAHVKYYQPVVVPDLGVSFLNLNTEKTSSPLASLAARQAITYALNIPAILKAGGLSGDPVNQLIPSVLAGYDPSVESTPYNPTKAKRLLAGVPNLSTPLTLDYPAGDNGQVGAIVQELNAVGFHVKTVEISDVGTLVNNMLTGAGDMFYLSYSSNTLDGLDMIDSTVAAGTANYNSVALNNLISQAGSTLDPTSRIATLQQIERLVAANVPTVALYRQIRTFALIKPYIVNINLPATDVSVYFDQVYQK
jgi:peptide/nickel transport system substrate-binding protein